MTDFSNPHLDKIRKWKRSRSEEYIKASSQENSELTKKLFDTGVFHQFMSKLAIMIECEDTMDVTEAMRRCMDMVADVKLETKLIGMQMAEDDACRLDTKTLFDQAGRPNAQS